jgi:PAT family beta-lactamase induction signal transducer AmpG
MATQDIAVDAYIVESLDRGEEPTGAAASTIGTSIGMVVGGSLLVGLYDTFGWEVVMQFAAVMLVVGSLLAMILPERPPRNDAPAPPLSLTTTAREIAAHLKSPASIQVLGVVLLVQFAIAFPFRIEGAFLVDKGLTLTEIGFLGGGAATIGSVFGTLLGERMGRRWGLRKAIALCAFSAAIIAGTYIFVAASPITAWEYALINLMVTVIGAPLGVLFNAARFRWSSPSRTATDYTLQSSLTYVAQAAASVGAGLLAGWIGWTGFYIVAGGVLLATFIFLGAIFQSLSDSVDRRDRAIVGDPSLREFPVAGVPGSP